MIGIGNNDDITLKLGTSTVSKAYWGTQQVYPNVTPPTPSGYETQYFTIEATSAGTLYFDDNTTPFEYSLNDGSTWNTSTTTNTYNLGNGEKILFRCTNPSINSEQGIGHFYASDGQFKVYGNIMSLLYGSNFIGQTTFPYADNSYVFSELMYSFTTLTDAENLVLPATTLATHCYYQMFESCTALETPPTVLPATTLAESCYSNMFHYCSSLTSAPALPATTLASSCYGNMFNGCTSLTTAPALPATTLASRCYQQMFKECTLLTSVPSVLPATTLALYCYNQMFYGCTSLTTAPALPATTLTGSCYSNMFNGCTALTTAPVLPATTLTGNGCYVLMFNGCSNLNYIKAMFITTPGTTYTNKWVSGVAQSGTFVKNSAAQWTTTGVNGVPNGWTVQTASE